MAKKQFNARELMELAVQVMRESVAEQRADGKASPLVGAVLWRPDGSRVTACRGELRDGDHAEFTLLERKHRDVSVSDGVLFATLEPCAPGARKEPKKSCAERIVLARIKTVYVGVEDPDPTVDRKGIKYLQDKRVDVVMFDNDLQEEIRKINKAFWEQALERAAAAKEEKSPVVVTLSSMEKSLPRLSLRDFEINALERFRAAVKANEPVDSEAFARRLAMRGLAEEGSGGQFKPTGFGAVLFGSNPREVMPQAGLKATIHYPDGTDEIRDFDGPLVSIPGDLEQWLQDKMPNTIDRNQMARGEVLSVPFAAIREAVVNALVHRNYDVVGAKCQLIITQDRITVRSPGDPVDPITLERMNDFTASTLSRNPPLHFVFSQMGLAEERGLGMKTLRDLAKLGLPLPRFSWDDPYLDLTIFRSAESTAPAEVLAKLSEVERKGWFYVASQGKTNTPQYGEHMHLDERTARRHLVKFAELGLVSRSGKGRASHYVVAKEGFPV